MSISRFFYAQYRHFAMARQKRAILKTAAPAQMTPADWPRSLKEPTEFYRDCYRYFHQRLPAELQEHRAYFFKGLRGFNEDAMHVMWFMLFAEFKPANFLEIGVFRGQTISLAALLSRRNGVTCAMQGISPFDGAGDSVSKYPQGFDYQQDTLSHFEHFGLPKPALLKAYSTAPEAVALIRSRTWDMIYIDGNHDYDVARQDWEVCSQSTKCGGIIVMDDSGSTTSYRPPIFATAGLPDPSRLAQEIDRSQFREILQVGHNRVFQKLI
jgi:Methyltransferase domain